MTPEKLEKAAAERATVIADAKALLPTVKTEGCTCEQIKREVIASKTGDNLVTAVLGGVAVGDAKPDQVDTVFFVRCQRSKVLLQQTLSMKR